MARLNSYDVVWTVAGAKKTSVNMGATSTSDPIQISAFRSFSVNSAWTTTSAPVGLLDVQVCNAHDRPQLNSGDTQNWTTLVSLQLKPGTDPSPGLQQVLTNSFGWYRLVYTVTSGGASDTLTAQFQGQAVA